MNINIQDLIYQGNIITHKNDVFAVFNMETIKIESKKDMEEKQIDLVNYFTIQKKFDKNYIINSIIEYSKIKINKLKSDEDFLNLILTTLNDKIINFDEIINKSNINNNFKIEDCKKKLNYIFNLINENYNKIHQKILNIFEKLNYHNYLLTELINNQNFKPKNENFLNNLRDYLIYLKKPIEGLDLLENNFNQDHVVIVNKIIDLCTK